ncbi:hypothetical protein EK21DRAFT_118160 [Setomelanomma holmii]|uniref:Uncharacterized protein n=1 Tax=Setomelanomma holmii TaxID=210430 RepID=A0A9P4GY08_9PLEO|nr:hypothetical protein EK21DRAFT_118160 [Setomelanomma holmii]
MATLRHLFSQNVQPVLTATLSFLEIGDVLALTPTCRALRGLPHELLSTNFDINRSLKKCFSRPKEFRSIQTEHDAVIVKGFARNFFARRITAERCVDIYVPDPHFPGPTLRKYLEEEGYYDHRWPQDDRDWFEMIDKNGRQWGIVIDWGMAPETTVAGNIFRWAKTTACLHFITWNRAYAIFLYTTFIRSEFNLVYMSKRIDDYILDLYTEGIQIKSIHRRQAGIAGDCDTLTRRRRFRDKYTWKK